MIRFIPLLLLLTVPLPARADEEARSHFHEGMRRLARGDYEAACAAFRRSEADGPAVGSSYQLGRCNEEQGKHGVAYESYHRAAELARRAGDAERAAVAETRAEEAAKRAPKLRLRLPESAPASMTIALDGKELPRASWTGPTPIAEGERRVEIRAPGHESASRTVKVERAGQLVELAIPALVPARGSSTPIDAARVAGEPPRRNPALFWTGIGLTIGGGVALVAGAAHVGQAQASGGEAPPEGIALLVGSAALLGVGMPFFIVYGRREPAEPSVAVRLGPLGAGVAGRF